MLLEENIDRFPVILYRENTITNNVSLELKSMLSTISSIPGIKEIIRFSETFSGHLEHSKRGIIFDVKFDKFEGRTGVEFLHRSLERSLYWFIETKHLDEYFSISEDLILVELICEDISSGAVRDFLRCVNTEINTNLRWSNHYHKFNVISTLEFKRIK